MRPTSRTFKDFAGGQLYLEHAGNPSRLKSTSVRDLVVDLDEFSSLANAAGRRRPGVDGRRPHVGIPVHVQAPLHQHARIKGISRIEQPGTSQDQRRFHVTVP
jgi:hypothetical protein